MKLEEMKRIADARSKGEWEYNAITDDHREADIDCSYDDETDTIIHRDSGVYGPESNDAEFIIMAANNWDKLMAVVETAKFLDDNLENWFKLNDTDSLAEICLSLHLYLKELEEE